MKASRSGLHYAWVVLGALVVVMLMASGLRAVFGVFLAVPMALAIKEVPVDRTPSETAVPAPLPAAAG